MRLDLSTWQEVEAYLTRSSGIIIPPGSTEQHGPPDDHRRDFPDGRVGSHSALARPEHGEALIQAAAKCVAADYLAFLSGQ